MLTTGLPGSYLYACDQPGCTFAPTLDALVARGHYGLMHAARLEQVVEGVTAGWFDHHEAYREWLWARQDRGQNVVDGGVRGFRGAGWYLQAPSAQGLRLLLLDDWQHELEVQVDQLRAQAERVHQRLIRVGITLKPQSP